MSRVDRKSRMDEKFQRSEFRHNPYIGTFQRTKGGIDKSTLPQSSPHVGTFRHAPVMGCTEGLKANLKPVRRNFISNLQISQQRRTINMVALKNLPLSVFNPGDCCDDIPVCAICLDAFKDGDELRNLNCSHCFHRACVDIWLLGTLSYDIQLNGTCPTCRQNAASSPKKPVLKFMNTPAQAQPCLTISTIMPQNAEENENCTPLICSVSHSQLSVRSSNSDTYDILSPMSPAWSDGEIFHVDNSDNDSLVAENFLSELSLQIHETSNNAILTSTLDNIHEDAATCTSLTTDDECDVISIFSDSQYSDCGFPL